MALKHWDPCCGLCPVVIFLLTFVNYQFSGIAYRQTVKERSLFQFAGATKPVYAPEPYDVGQTLRADVVSEGRYITLSTTGPIEGAPGLGSYVEALVRKHDIEFNVVIVQICGIDHPSDSINFLHVGRMRIKLTKGKTTVAKEYYSSSMQLCRVRGGPVLLARRFAYDCNITLVGPDDRSPSSQ